MPAAWERSFWPRTPGWNAKRRSSSCRRNWPRTPERRQRFLNEARAASALNHPHVCVVYDVGETDDGLPFIAMEFVEGRSLDSGPETGGRSKSPQIVEIAAQVADALDAAHACRIVHRDIKPANISLNERGQVKVLDFGLAKRSSRRNRTRRVGDDRLDAADPGGPGPGNAAGT